MKRKIIQVGDSTQLVSIPRKWALQRNIKKGDEVDVLEQGDELVIHTGKSAKTESVVIDITKAPTLAERYLIAAYRSGYDEVKILYEGASVFQRLQRTAANILMGFEIVQQGENTCTFRNISENLSTEFQNILRRAWLITLDLANNSFDVLQQQQWARIPEVTSLETANNKFTLFCQRLLSKYGDGSPRKTAYRFTIIYQLEKIADHYKYICEEIDNARPKKVKKDIAKLYAQVNQFLRQYYELYYSFDKIKADGLARQYVQLLAAGKKAFTSKPFEDALVHNLLGVVQLTFNLIGAQLALEL